MDPTATLVDLLGALATMHADPDSFRGSAHDEALNALDDLRGWLERGGFAPAVTHLEGTTYSYFIG